MNQKIVHFQQDREALVDSFGRKIEYVRLSVTDKCNLRCFYCLPKGFRDFEAPAHWLSFDEIERVMRAFSELGVRRIRMTGGEPLVRKNLPELVQRLSRLPNVDDLSLSTNASLLGAQAEALKSAGVARINVSLDTLKADRFREVTQGGDLIKVLAGLQAAKKAGLNPVKINMVALKGINDDEFDAMLEYCMRNDFTLRFIEAMPIGAPGQSARDHYLDLNQVRDTPDRRYNLVPGVMAGGGPARHYKIQGTDFKIGFITPISQHFCDTCNRVRISVDGTLYLCLGQENSLALRPLLRDGITDVELKQTLSDAIWAKPARHEFDVKPGQIDRCMSQTGG